jgi:hypothetical protein
LLLLPFPFIIEPVVVVVDAAIIAVKLSERCCCEFKLSLLIMLIHVLFVVVIRVITSHDNSQVTTRQLEIEQHILNQLKPATPSTFTSARELDNSSNHDHHGFNNCKQ